MTVLNVITGFVNFFSFLALSVTTSSETSFLGSAFILAASLFLEALSLQNDLRHIKSLLLTIFMGCLYFISITGIVFSVVGLAQFVNIYFAGERPLRIMVSSFSHGTYYIAPTEINKVFCCFGMAATAIPFCLACREIILQKFRASYYNLAHGLYGK